MSIIKPALARSRPSKALSSQDGCHLETLARSHVLHVQRCSHCNTLSLHVGPLTLRFDAEGAESFWNTLGQALLALHAQRIDEPPTQAGSSN
jgi:hypothetical protein